ncbi:SGNH hydrolase domain-containing protein [Streptomyces sp. NPDC059680]|uniref:SGNH hydrolase domain-containing protein n=1 Tax=Streptomyces sp. NPDC059680 TaxID=3346904 RepID=UPI00369ADBB1
MDKKVLSVGDSWAVHMQEGMRAASPGTVVYGEGIPGCGIRLTVDNVGSACNQWPVRWPQLMEEYRPDAVLLMIARWDVIPQRSTPNGPARDLTDPVERLRFEQNLDSALDILSARNTPVYVMNDVFVYNTSSLLMNKLIEIAARHHPNVHVLNLHDQLCHANNCPSTLLGMPVYDATWHTTHGAGMRLGAWILNQMFQPGYQG